MFVIWEPVLPTDFGAPSTFTLRRISDPRASQYWDKRHVVSKLLGENDKSSVVWDYVAVFQPGQLWESVPPQNVYSHVPVVQGIDGVRDAIRGLKR